jgi:hypothetical protein
MHLKEAPLLRSNAHSKVVKEQGSQELRSKLGMKK